MSDPGADAAPTSIAGAAPEPAPETAPAAPQPAFAHASEAEMARILDFYGVRWAYEPTTFPILWNLDGAVVESFAPDFYLPDFDLYLEMTTLRQKLVRKKNRKLRRLRELYPDVRIKLFYARDFRELMLKYGKLALHGALSGTTGQATPPRASVPGPTTSVPGPTTSVPEPTAPEPDGTTPEPAAPAPAAGLEPTVPVPAVATPMPDAGTPDAAVEPTPEPARAATRARRRRRKARTASPDPEVRR